jgi:V8-like Glu-specific endopeptidase
VAKSDGPSFTALRKAANTVNADRATLVALFDAALKAWTAAGANDVPVSFNLALVLGRAAATSEGAQFDETGTRDALALALLGVGDALFAHGFLVQLIQQEAAGDTGGESEEARKARAVLFEKLRDLLFTKEERRAELQRLTHVDAGQARPKEMSATLDKAAVRICRVLAQLSSGDIEIGTGFLIGPSCVLTNWHVVEKLTRPQLAVPERLWVEFDFLQGKPTGPQSQSQFAAAADWLVAHSTTGATQPANAETGRTRNTMTGEIEADWWMDQSCREAWCDTLSNTLDYAVIRLQGNPGARRAHFDLWAPQTNVAMTADCMVVHHPNGIGQSVNVGIVRTELTHATRMFHTASTQRGSSGAMLFELGTGLPIGLHYLGLGPEAKPNDPPFNAPQQVINVAISLNAIAADLQNNNHDRVIQEPSELMLNNGCLATGDPVFARSDLMSKLTGMKPGGAQQIMWIEVPYQNGSPAVDYGRSYSIQIVKSLFPAPTHVHIQLEAAAIPPDAATLFSQMAERIVVDPAMRPVPPRETSAEAYDKVLFDAFADLISRHLPRGLIWLMIDDLDVHDLPDTEARHFLDRLYAQVKTIPKLRIILVGLKIQLQVIPEELMAHSSIDICNLDGLSEHLRKWLDERSAAAGPLGEKARNLVASLALTNIAEPNALRNLHSFTKYRIEPVLRRHFESAP